MLRRNSFMLIFLTLLFLAILFVLPSLAQEKPQTFYHEIPVSQFNKNRAHLEYLRMNFGVNFDLKSEKFDLKEVRELINISGGAEFKVVYGAHQDGKVCSMLTVYDQDGHILKVFQRGSPCPPICDGDEYIEVSLLNINKLYILRRDR